MEDINPDSTCESSLSAPEFASLSAIPKEKGK
jgi:hypothetical protein